VHDQDDLQDDLTRWNAVGPAYADAVGGGLDSITLRFWDFLWRGLGDLDGCRVLDVGCGHGWLAGAMAARGAEVSGVDGSASLVEIARRGHPEVRFELADLVEGLPPALRDGAFDRVVAHMVLMDLPTIAPVLRDVGACLAPQGTFIVTMLHPSFFLQSPVEDPVTGERYRKVTGYLDPEMWWVESFGGHRHYHRPFSEYVNELASAGLTIVEMIEPPTPTAPTSDRDAGWSAWFATIPTTLGLVCAKRSL